MNYLNYGSAEEYVTAVSEMYVSENFERRFEMIETETLDKLSEVRECLIRELQEEVKLYQQEWHDDWKREHAANR